MRSRWRCETCRLRVACMESVRAGGPFARQMCEAPYRSTVRDDAVSADLSLTNAGVKLVRLLGQAERPLSTNDIMDRLEVSRSYCYRLLLALVQAGKLERSRVESEHVGSGCGWGYVYQAVDRP